MVIVDEFTGRLMPGRRWSDGLHQAVEAKEGIKVQQREPDARLDHLPELLPHVREARGHDRHRRHRGGRVREDLRPRRDVVPDQPPDDPQRPRRRGLQDQSARSSTRSSRRSSARHETGQPILVGTISIENSEQLSRAAQQARHPARRAERQAARARGRDRRPGRPLRRGHDLDQHGRPRHRHRARRQRRVPGARQVRRRHATTPTTCASSPSSRRSCAAEREQVVAAGGLHILGTERHESRRIDNQLRGRAGPPGRPGLGAVLPLARGRPAAHLRRRPHQALDGAARPRGRRGDRAPHDQPRDRERAEEGRGAQLRHPQAPARVRRRDEQAAPGLLRRGAASCWAARTCTRRCSR